MSSGNSFQNDIVDVRVETHSATVDSKDELDGSEDSDFTSEFEGQSSTTEADTSIIVPSGSKTEPETFSSPIDAIIVPSDDETEQLLLDSMDVPQYLYDGCEITSQSASLLLKTFVYRHHLSGKAQTDLLRLFQLLLPKPITLPKSLYLFHKGECISEDITRHYYCTRCSALVENPVFGSVCPNDSCGKESRTEIGNFFVQLNIENQLKTLLPRKANLLHACIITCIFNHAIYTALL